MDPTTPRKLTPRSLAAQAARSLAAVGFAVLCLVLVNQCGGWIAGVVKLPPGGTGRLAWDLAWIVLGGTVAFGVLSVLAPRAPGRHVLALLGLLMLVAGWAVATMGGDFPAWFSAGLLLSLPLQAWLGPRWAAAARRGAADQ